jgi:hypothetical protein
VAEPELYVRFELSLEGLGRHFARSESWVSRRPRRRRWIVAAVHRRSQEPGCGVTRTSGIFSATRLSGNPLRAPRNTPRFTPVGHFWQAHPWRFSRASKPSRAARPDATSSERTSRGSVRRPR